MPKEVPVIKLVLEKYPEAVQKVGGAFGMFPLHYACESQASLEVIPLLIEIYPEASETCGGRLPHAATALCACNHGNSL